ncbi:RNA polymerase sigma factor [Cognatilysobacter bugurensis]|uniref:DNA-directed RNA polymerase sigma-70 factor n=1 Tax=Cognatilysobacter bugurensis TaxID=543356 RepID=A0A918T0C0_9GAMM|nr:sigma-70 family RNA polymerase sigma factor [Lysobacter bugurensis]GHA80197.1 DNA-directed RNA polymerase sigma-70 factor [Lysobacter bugurensis]
MSTAATHAEPVAATLESVLAEHGPMLSRIASSHEADPTRRQDLVQEMGVALWRALPQWRAQASLRTYVARVAQNCAVDHVMRHAGRGFVELEDVHVDATADPVAQAEGDQRRARLLDAVRRLPIGQRQVVVLSLEGFSQREAADALGLEENTVNQRLSRARKQLRAWLEETA